MKQLFLALLLLANTAFATGIDKSLADHILKWRDVHVGSSAMDTAYATPVEVLGSSIVDADKAFEIVSVACFNDFNDTVGDEFEAGSGTLDFQLYDSTGSVLVAQFSNTFLESTSDTWGHAYARDHIIGLGASSRLQLSTSADVTDGEGEMRCRVYYRVIEFEDI